MAMTLATHITVFRILLIPVFVGLAIYYGQSVADGAPNEGYRWGAIFTFALATVLFLKPVSKFQWAGLLLGLASGFVMPIVMNALIQ